MANEMIATAQTGEKPIWRFWGLLGLAFALVLTLYWNTFAWWWTEWTWSGSFYAHSIFVPFFVLVMIYRNRESLQRTPLSHAWGGSALIVLALLLLFFGERGSVAVVKSISFVMLMFGTVLMVIGGGRTRVLFFPLIFSIMMIPLIPDQLVNHVAFPIQIASTTIAVKFLNLLLLSANQQGTLVTMEHYRMAVELPCSGFKTLLSLTTFTAAFAYVMEGDAWRRWITFGVTLPMSLLFNAFRITMIGIAGELISTEAAGKFHDYSGFIVLLMAFFFLYTFARIIKCKRFLGLPMNDEEEKKEEEYWKAVKSGEIEPEPPLYKRLMALFPSRDGLQHATKPLLCVNAILILALALHGLVPKLPPASAPIGKQQVPAKFNHDGTEFKVQRWENYDRLAKDVEEELQPLRIINRLYIGKGGHGERVQLMITAGNGRKVFHDPHTCSLGVNAMMRDIQVLDIPTKWGTLKVLESQYHEVKKDTSYKVMMFYVMEDHIMQRTEQVRNRLFWQMLFGDSGKPSYFVRILNDQPGEEGYHRENMKRFIAGMWNEIGGVLMGKEPTIPEPLDFDSARK